MANKPLVTVLLPVFNAEAFLHQAIASILEQSFADFEFLIINDGSTDGSQAIIESFKDARIRCIVHAKNKGLIATLNEGIVEARTDLIARMDADDISLPNRLQAQYDYMTKHGGVVLLGTEARAIDMQDGWLYDQTCLHTHEALWRLLAVCSPFVHGSVMFRKTAVVAAGAYRAESYTAEDYDLWIRLARQGKIANLPDLLYQWRSNPKGESHMKAQEQRKMCRDLGDQHWEQFGRKGPAPLSAWSKIWTAQEIQRQPRDERRRQLAHFHIYFARSYRRHGNYWLGVAHLVGAWWLRPLSIPFYFYYVLLPIIPIQLFMRLEGWLLDVRLRSQI